MINLIWKDFLTISRDRSELLTLLAMPMILISILGFALGGLMTGNTGISEIPIALIVENDLQNDMERLEQTLEEEGMPKEIIEEIISGANSMEPTAILLDVLENPELDDLIDLRTDYDKDRANEALLDDEIAGIITIPEGFTFDTLKAFYLEEESESSIDLFVQDQEQIRANVMNNILTSFANRYNLELSIAQATNGEMVGSSLDENNFGESTYLSTGRAISSFQYYTIGMAVMFALYVASSISSNAFKEKYTHVFSRLISSGERPLKYLLSKGISATFLSTLQLLILFLTTTLIFQTFSELNAESWIFIGILTLCFSLVIGSLASLLTAISLWANSDAVSGIFSGALVSIFAFAGGSMMPVEEFSPFLKQVGNWTPNGAMMTSYLQIIQGFPIHDVLPMLYRILGMTALFFILSILIFPKRRLS